MSYPGKLKIRKSNTGILLFLLILTLQVSEISGQNEIPDSLVKVQIQSIQNMLNQGKPAAKLWWNGWFYGYSAATMVQGIVCLESKELKTRQDMALGAVTTLIGAAGQLLMPMIPASAPKKLALIPGETPEGLASPLE